MFIPKKIGEKIIIENPYRKVIQKDLIMRNGEIYHHYIAWNSETHLAVIIFPLTKNKRVIYNKEWRSGIEDFVYQFPMGMKEKELSLKQVAKKELEEESGYISDEISFLWKTIISNYENTILYYYLAKNCKKTKQQLENGENIEVKTCSLASFEKKITNGKINCPITISAYSFAKLKGKI